MSKDRVKFETTADEITKAHELCEGREGKTKIEKEFLARLLRDHTRMAAAIRSDG